MFRSTLIALLATLGPLTPLVQAAALARYYVPIIATSSTSPTPRIVLNWTADSFATNWAVYRRDADVVGGFGDWTATNAADTGTSYTDTNVSPGSAYEYCVVKKGYEGTNFTGSSYILAGLEAPAIENRGKLVLMVDSSFAVSLAPELSRLVKDLEGDGWEVLRHDVDKSLTAPQIKAVIRAEYDADTNKVKSVFLFGHLAIPYSGTGPYAAVTHSPDTRGAQPTDLYYGDMSGLDGSDWTDTNTETTASIYKHHNIPGDGKFDQAFVPGDGPTNRPGPADAIVELEVGRVDFSDMPAFKVSETELLRRYLTKNHNFRHKKNVPVTRALMMTEGGTSDLDAYRNFSPMVGLTNIFSTGMYVPALADPDPAKSSYLWAGAFGTGQRECIAGIMTSTDHANNTMNAVFTVGFSSYWHDYDVQNSLYRAPLAGEGATLVRLYARGVWFLHEMGLGRNIGSSVRRSQSQDWERVPLYTEPISFSGQLSIYSLMSITHGSLYHSLMGDPTLRASYVAPPANVTVSGAVISWEASPDSVAGYHVYRQDGGTGPFNRLDHVGTANLVIGLSFTDPSPYGGQAVYMVRAIKLEACPSGSFFNPSQGVTVAYPASQVQLAETTDGVPSAPRSLESGTYQHLQAGPPPVGGGPYVCTWTGTGSVPSGGKGSNVTVVLDQASTVAWTWTTNHPSVVNITAPSSGVYKPSVNVAVKATITDVDGQIVKVEFLDENQNLLPGADTFNLHTHNPNPAISSYYDWDSDGNGSYFAGWYVDSVLGKLYWSNQPYDAQYRYTWSAPAAGAHSITVKAYDVFGGVTTSAPVFFTVGSPAAPLTITAQPLSQTVDVGQRPAFSVAATGGTLPYSYSWKWNSTIITFQPNDAYVANPASPKHHYYTTYEALNGVTYSAVVTDSMNNSVTSDVAVLTVTVPPPTITNQPLNQSVLDNQTATFSVGVSAVVPPSGLIYQWEKQVPTGTSWMVVSVATNMPSYAAVVTTADSGNLYRVKVSHKTDWIGDGYLPGSVTSSPALLTVTETAEPPTITTPPSNQTVSVGQPASFSVVAAGTAPLFYQWRTNGAAIDGATGTGYTTAATMTNDSGTLYSVVVSNTLGSVTSVNAILTVTLAAPAITTQPANRTVTAGQTASFSVVASGTAPLYYQWRTNAVAIGGATNTAYTTAATVTNDSGTLYSVVVSNAAGSVTSSNALLTVTAASAAPVITLQPSNRTVTAGQTASFSVTATGTAPLYYQWRTNGGAIGGATGAGYTTPVTVTNDSGTLYSVVVSNGAGSVTSSNALLTVNAAAVAAGLPVVDSFEPYAPGTGVAGTNGWVGEADAGIVTALTYAVRLPPGYPLPQAAHSRVLRVVKPLQNDLPGASNQNVAVDFILQTDSRAEPETPGISLQAGLCVDTQGVVRVWHLYDQGGMWTQRWTALGNEPLGTGHWVRVSLWFDYTNNPAGHTLFRPALDGVVYPTAYGVAGPTNLASPGPWYVCANSPATGRGGARKISGFRIESDQPCRIDDFLVTPGPLAYTVPGGLLMVR